QRRSSAPTPLPCSSQESPTGELPGNMFGERFDTGICSTVKYSSLQDVALAREGTKDGTTDEVPLLRLPGRPCPGLANHPRWRRHQATARVPSLRAALHHLRGDRGASAPGD